MMAFFGNDDNPEQDPMSNGFMPDLSGAHDSPENLGNTHMADFPKDDSAMNIVNSPQVTEEFGMGSAPVRPPLRGLRRAVPKLNHSVGDISWNTGETWGVLLGGIALGMLTLTLWNRATR